MTSKKILQITPATTGWFAVWDDLEAAEPDLVFHPIAFWALYEDEDGTGVEGVDSFLFENGIYYDPGGDRVDFVGYMAPGQSREEWVKRAQEARSEAKRPAPVPQPITRGSKF